MSRFFGTDGVRGVAHKELTCAMAYALGETAVDLLGPRLVVGRDTRLSGPALEAALVAGIESKGGMALLCGIVPTPAIALFTRTAEADGGIVISASHNPPEYNGIKFFDSAGFKLPKEKEDKLEDCLQRLACAEGRQCKGHEGCEGYNEHDKGRSIFAVVCNSQGGSLLADAPSASTASQAASALLGGTSLTKALNFNKEAEEGYIEHAAATVRAQNIDLSGLVVAVDAGHGASGTTTPQALKRLGATVVAVNADLNGTHINVRCGSTHLDPLKALISEHNADVGIAHDGDADRLIVVDAEKTELDGDIIEAIIALDYKRRNELAKNTVVSTVGCNLGFRKAMQENNISVVLTDIGDSNVLAAMREGGYNVGGEQSGHLIFLEHNSTGDGLIAALQLLAILKRSGRPLSELSGVMTRYPQVMINIAAKDKYALEHNKPIAEALALTEERLSHNGRVLLRASGTEPLVRVMVEAADEKTALDEATRLAAVIKKELA